jgi:hypothetical protein
MKTITTLLFTCIVSCFALAQSTSAVKSIGMYFPVLANNQLSSREIDDTSPLYQGKGYYTVGLNFLYSTCSCSAYEIGLEYSNHSVTITPTVDQQNNPAFGSSIMLLSVPASLRLTFLKYFFLTGGILLDIDISNHNSISNQSGLGAVAGLGIKYDFKSGTGFYVNPFYKSHSWISFSGEYNRQKLNGYGIRLGVLYSF